MSSHTGSSSNDPQNPVGSRSFSFRLLLGLTLAALVTGVFSGLGAIVLHYVLDFMQELAFGQAEGHHPMVTDGADPTRRALVLAALGQGITVTGLRQDSRQGDRRALTLCRELPQQVSLRENPDLLPPLALLAALRPDKEIRFTDAARLRHKESDRLAATAALLTALGGRAQETADGLAVRGVACLQGGEVQSAGDHRLAMLAACAAPFCREPVVLRGADCTAKSYPAFWRDYAQLGGKVEHLT